MRNQFASPKELDRNPSRLRLAMANGMAQIPGGTFRMGSDAHYPEERPAHTVRVDGFWIDRYAVTNADFAAFIAATGYVTFAERPLDPALYPGADPDLLKPASAAAQHARLVGVRSRRRLATSRRARQHNRWTGKRAGRAYRF